MSLPSEPLTPSRIVDVLGHTFQLDEIVEWLCINHVKKAIIQLNLKDMKFSTILSNYVKAAYTAKLPQSTLHSESGTDKSGVTIDLYFTRANTCCVDFLVTQHVTKVDAIIRIGQVCLSQPVIKNQQALPPVLFVFKRTPIAEDRISSSINQIASFIESSMNQNAIKDGVCVFYDTSLIEYAIALEKKLAQDYNISEIEVANLYCSNSNWSTTEDCQHKFVRERNADSHIFGYYLLKKHISRYNCAIYLGEHLSIQLALECPSILEKISLSSNEFKMERFNSSKLLNCRIAQISRIKEASELKIGVLITNPLPDLLSVMERFENYTKQRKHILYYISMIQTIDEFKIGNFDLCDAFVVVNSCNCSTILESLVFNRPILTEHEYKLACGFEAYYGNVLWPGTSSHLIDECYIENERKLSDVSLALVHTRKELLERCSQARINKWSGLEYSASSGDHESLTIEEGLDGIASTYVSEPLKKEN